MSDYPLNRKEIIRDITNPYSLYPEVYFSYIILEMMHLKLKTMDFSIK